MLSRGECSSWWYLGLPRLSPSLSLRELRAAASKKQQEQQKRREGKNLVTRLTFYPSGRYMQSGQKQKIEIPHHLLAIVLQHSPSNMYSLSQPQKTGFFSKHLGFYTPFLFFNFLIHFFLSLSRGKRKKAFKV